MISRIAVRLRWLRRKLNRTHWAARFLGIEPPKGEADQPGVIVMQIDGLSRTQMERALASGKLPFLARLIERGHFTLESFYSGVPSTTPAVQGEIFYGVRAAVPSFEFFRRSASRVFRMNEATAAAEIEAELEKQCDEPLLKGGYAYSNIYRGGAFYSRYCSQDLAPERFVKRLKLVKGLILAIAYAPKVFRIVGLAVLEFGLAIVDMCKGLYEREDFFKELAFVPARILVCIMLREMIRFRVLLDIERGVQVIHANFLGYDEQAHRRGPDSAFAHWTLKGIDRTVRDICRAASHSPYRDYEWIIYSDHGQEHTVPYDRKHGRGIDAALSQVFSKGPLADTELWMSQLPAVLGHTLDRWRHFFSFDSKSDFTLPDPGKQIILTALGPVAHLYFPKTLAPAELEDYANDIVSQADVPLVLLARPDGSVSAFTRHGTRQLPGDPHDILGTPHPFPDEAAEDLIRLVHHPDAGDLVLSGWDPDDQPLTFAIENGSHGGPGSEETRGFLLVPDRIRRWHVAHIVNTGDHVRGEALRKIIRHYLGRDGIREERVPHYPARNRDVPLRVMTYNIHSCVGVDGKIRPERVARVINHCDPDIVAVQEVDAHRERSGRHHQAELIADHLRMDHAFHAMFEEQKERYGIAIFSKHPFEIIKADFLTSAQFRPFREARGAIWIRLKIDGQRFHFINTHFGLGWTERERQVHELLGERWIGGIPEDEPLILCGDLNSGPRSKVVNALRRRLRDAQLAVRRNHQPFPTFSSVKPMLRIDHVFVSRHFTVEDVLQPKTPTARVASDHLPLCVELSLHTTHEAS